MSATDVMVRPHFSADGKDLAIEHVQDCDGIVERNKALRSEAQRSDWGRHVASIPNVVMVKWMNETGVMPFTKEFDELVARKLKDPEWAYLRTDSQAVQGWMGFGS